MYSDGNMSLRLGAKEEQRAEPVVEQRAVAVAVAVAAAVAAAAAARSSTVGYSMARRSRMKLSHAAMCDSARNKTTGRSRRSPTPWSWARPVRVPRGLDLQKRFTILKSGCFFREEEKEWASLVRVSHCGRQVGELFRGVVLVADSVESVFHEQEILPSGARRVHVDV